MTPHLSDRDWKVTLTGFALAYGFLNRVFYEPPTADFINTLVDGDLFADWPLDTVNEETEIGLRLLQAFSAHWSDEGLPDLVWDFTRLFIGPAHVLAPPWESVYLSRDGLLFDEQTVQVRRVYARYGLQAPRLNAEPDDHLGLELALMVHLCSLGLNALQQDDVAGLESSLQAQRDFLKEHLLRWAPQCLGLVIQHANSDYYRGAAHLALGCLEQAAATLGLDMPQEVRA